MKSQRPYLVRALYEWIIDSDTTPYVLVSVAADGDIAVPREYVQDGKIVLNVSPTAVRNLELSDTHMTFDGRFSGRAFLVNVPMSAITAVYAKENGQGMMFDEPDAALNNDTSLEQSSSLGKQSPGEPVVGGVNTRTNPSAPSTDGQKPSHLTVVK